MKRLTITVAAVAAALAPAFAGLWGNATFSQAVPVRVPASAQVAPATAPRNTAVRTTEVGDDHGGRMPRDQRTEPGDDRRNPTATTAGTTTRTVTRTPVVGDDRGGATPRAQRTETGDDRRAGGHDDTAGHDDTGGHH
jgi:hypothetical protein